MSSDICLRCKQRRKRSGHWFCSDRCTQIAAGSAPQLMRVPKDHVLYNEVKRSFKSNWESSKQLPTIAAVYLITMTKQLRESFETYRTKVYQRSRPKYSEVKRFRCEFRACRLGESEMRPCSKSTCSLCLAIKTGFKATLARRQQALRAGNKGFNRFGGGVYMAPSSNKAYQYANTSAGNSSKYKTMLCVRTVLGKVQYLYKEDHNRMKPDRGYDSVETRLANQPREVIVYDSDAVRAGFLILCK